LAVDINNVAKVGHAGSFDGFGNITLKCAAAIGYVYKPSPHLSPSPVISVVVRYWFTKLYIHLYSHNEPPNLLQSNPPSDEPDSHRAVQCGAASNNPAVTIDRHAQP